MAALAKLLGVLCLFTGAAGICLAVVNFVLAIDGGTTDETAGLLGLVTAAMVAGGLFLMTVGAIAGVVADMAASRQPARAAQAAERPYGATTRVVG